MIFAAIVRTAKKENCLIFLFNKKPSELIKLINQDTFFCINLFELNRNDIKNLLGGIVGY